MQRNIRTTELTGLRAKALLDAIWGGILSTPEGLGSCEAQYVQDRAELMSLVGRSAELTITVTQIS